MPADSRPNPAQSAERLAHMLGGADKLPTLPAAAAEVLRLSQDPQTSIDDLARAIANDPALTAKILKLVNSGQFSPRGEITSLTHAAVLLGLNTVKLMTLSFLVTGNLPRQEKGGAFDHRRYWLQSLAMAVSGRYLARLVKSRHCDEAFLCGLLSHLGQLVMASSIPEKYGSVLAEGEGLPSAGVERQVLGFDHHDLGSTLLRSWNLPPLICDVIAGWGQPDQRDGTDAQTRSLRRILQLAGDVSTILCDREKGHALYSLRQGARKNFGLAEPEVDALVLSLEGRMAELAPLLNVEFFERQDYQALLDEARQQLVQLTLGTAIDLRQSNSRVEELAKANEELENRANTDKLTGLANRACFDRTLSGIISSRLESDNLSSLAILVLDIDHFKSFNDTHGHQAGDHVLTVVGTTLREVTRDTDFAARYGGEEFVVILPNIELEDLQGAAERVREAMESVRIEYEGHSLRVTVSVGGARVARVEALSDGTGLVRIADECLYAAKKAGRNRVVCRDLELVPAN